MAGVLRLFAASFVLIAVRGPAGEPIEMAESIRSGNT
jgi:hypothetical protein